MKIINTAPESSAIWDNFEQQFVEKINKIRSIYLKKDFNISKTDGEVILKLVQSAAAYIDANKVSDKTAEEVRIITKNVINRFVAHSILQDLSHISVITDMRVNFNTNTEDQKNSLNDAFKRILEIVNQLKPLTKQK